jgi:hypothetical protein
MIFGVQSVRGMTSCSLIGGNATQANCGQFFQQNPSDPEVDRMNGLSNWVVLVRKEGLSWWVPCEPLWQMGYGIDTMRIDETITILAGYEWDMCSPGAKRVVVGHWTRDLAWLNLLRGVKGLHTHRPTLSCELHWSTE